MTETYWNIMNSGQGKYEMCSFAADVSSSHEKHSLQFILTFNYKLGLINSSAHTGSYQVVSDSFANTSHTTPVCVCARAHMRVFLLSTCCSVEAVSNIKTRLIFSPTESTAVTCPCIIERQRTLFHDVNFSAGQGWTADTPHPKAVG